MVRNLVVAGAVGLVAVACHDLPDVADGVCGNLVVDVDEDCDGFSLFGGDTQCGGAGDGAAACFYTCDPAPTGDVVCPQGWGCGHDGVCRRPSGTFESAPSSPWHMPVDDFAIGDVDGDGKADLIGNDTSNVTVRFGSASAEFPDELTTKIRRPTGEVTYAHFDDDELLDVIVPIDIGLFVMLGDGNRRLEPFPYASFSTGDEKLEFYAIDEATIPNGTVLVVIRADQEMGIQGNMTDYPTPPAPPGGEALILPPPVADLNGDNRREFILTHQGSDALYLYTITGADTDNNIIDPKQTGLDEPAVIPLPGLWRVDGGSMFADVDGDGDQDIIVSIKAGTARFLAVSYWNGLAWNSPVEPIAVLDSLLLTPGSLPLLAADFNSDGLADYAVETGIYYARPSGSRGQGVPPDGFDLVGTNLPDLWSDAVAGDFNGDGRLDLAVARFDAVNVRVLTGVDVFLHSQATFFNRFHIDAEAAPRLERSLQVGDFNGDLMSDVAFLADDLADGKGAVWAAFGAADGKFDPAQSMGRFDRLDHMTVANFAFSLGTIDGMTDILVASDGDPGTRVSAMFGDSSRRLVAPLVFDAALVTGGQPEAPQIPHRALVGDFNQDGVRDFLAVTSEELFEDNRETSNVWFVPGAGGEGDVSPQDALFTEFEQQEFNMRCSTWTVVDLEASESITQGADELIGLDDSAECRGLPEEQANPELVVLHVDPAATSPFSLHHAPLEGDLLFPEHLTSEDLDGDGDLDPAVLFRGYEVAGSDGAQFSASGVGLLWNEEGTPMDSGYTEITLPAGVRPLKVAPIAIDQDRYSDLLILASDGVYQALYDGDSASFTEPTNILPLSEGRLLDVGDVNGDGLDDMAIVYGKNVDVRLAVPAPPLGQGDIDNVSPSASGVSE